MKKWILFIFVTLTLVGCKSTDTEETFSADLSSLETDSLSSILHKHSVLVVTDSTKITFFRPDGSIYATQQSWHHEDNTNTEDSSVTETKKSTKVQVLRRTITTHVKITTTVSVFKKFSLIMEGVIYGLILGIMAYFAYRWKNN